MECSLIEIPTQVVYLGGNLIREPHALHTFEQGVMILVVFHAHIHPMLFSPRCILYIAREREPRYSARDLKASAVGRATSKDAAEL